MAQILGLVVVGALLGAGQPEYGRPRDGRQESNLRAVDAGNEGSPLSRDLRKTPLDLRKPSAFDRVYEVHVGPGRTVKYVRVDGALVAVFDRGAYEATAWGNAPLSPAGTTYMIGDPEKLFAEPSATPMPRRTESQRVDYWVGNDLVSLRESTTPDKPRPVAPETMWTSETVRRERVRGLLERAWGK